MIEHDKADELELDEIIRHKDVLKPQQLTNGRDGFIRTIDIMDIVESMYKATDHEETKIALSRLWNFLDTRA